MKTKEQTIELLETIARLLELKGENPFKIRAYTNAARALETFSGQFSDHGGGRQARRTELESVTRSRRRSPNTCRPAGWNISRNCKRSFRRQSLNCLKSRDSAARRSRLCMNSLASKRSLNWKSRQKMGELPNSPVLAAKTAGTCFKSIEQRRKHSGRILLSDAKIWSDELLEHFQGHPDVSQISAGGSFRRGRETIGDLDFLIATQHPQRIIEHFLSHHAIDRVLARGETKASVLLKHGIQADLRVVANLEFPFALCYFTGSKEHNVTLRGRALQNGWTLNEYRLGPEPTSKRTPKPIPEIWTEADLYRALGSRLHPSGIA